jgi:hypothetical protein
MDSYFRKPAPATEVDKSTGMTTLKPNKSSMKLGYA